MITASVLKGLIKLLAGSLHFYWKREFGAGVSLWIFWNFEFLFFFRKRSLAQIVIYVLRRPQYLIKTLVFVVNYALCFLNTYIMTLLTVWLIIYTLHKKQSFPLRISAVNVTKSQIYGFGHIYCRNP